MSNHTKKFVEIDSLNLSTPKPVILTKTFKKELAIFFVSIITLVSVFAFNLSVVNHSHFQALAENNFKTIELIRPERGLIFDRNGNPLTINEPVFNLKVDLTRLNLDPQEKQAVSEELLSLGLLDQLYAEVNNLVNQPNKTYVILRNINKDTAIVLKTFSAKHPSLEVINDFERYYPDGPAFADLVGYLGLVDKSITSTDYGPDDYIGKLGVESSQESYLRGQVGKEITEHDARGKILSVITQGQPQEGDNVYLTIDADLQKIVYESATQFFQANGFKNGAVIALDPQTGEVLAMASLPSFDNNFFTNGDNKEINRILKDSNQPLFNRVISGDYSPGSTIKPLVALAALAEHIIDQKRQIFTNGSISIPNPYDPSKFSIFRDWRNNGWTDMKKAIADSVNVYFYTIGGGYGDIKGLGVSKLVSYYKEFGLGSLTGIDFPGESPGFVPTPDWKRLAKPSDPIWRLGDTYNISIGQGDVLVTPLQIAQWTSIFANNGYLIQPRLIEKITDKNGKIIYQNNKIKESQLPINLKDIEIVKEGMRQTVTAGTGISLSDLPVEVAGKSGTPQTFSGQRLNAIFTAFFPYKNPKITLVVLVENAKEGSLAAIPIVRDIIEKYWALGKI